MPRTYDMTGRSAGMQRTRESILDAVVSLSDAWYDEVTIADIARRAGVSQQTVVNHFGSKLHLYLTAISERYVPEIAALRASATPGDPDAIVRAIVGDYEATGERTWRLLALAARVEEIQRVVVGGRRAHRQFVEEVFAPLLAGRSSAARTRKVTLLAIALDVMTWRQLRHDEGLSKEETARHLRELVGAVLA